MKILFFSRLFYPHIGGVEKHVLKLSEKLIEQGHSVTVITENYQSLPLSDSIKGIKIIRINAGKEDWFKKFRIWAELFKNINQIRTADIVHCHDVFFWYLPFKFLTPFKKVYTTFHGYEGNNIPNKRSVFMHKLSEKLSNGNICVGEFFNKWYGTKPTIVTYGAIDEVQVLNKNISKNNKIIFFGRLEKETGIMEYLKALKILKNKKINLEIDIYGEGSLKKQILKYSFDNKLKIKLKNTTPNIESVLKNYEYVFCSRYLGILESMYFKKPVFAEYNNPIKKDYLEMTPFAKYISISENAEEIAINFRKYKNKESNINTLKAYDFVKKQTWNNMASNYLRLWKF